MDCSLGLFDKRNNTFMDVEEIEPMMAERGKPCLSIIIPTIKYTRQRIQNPERVEKALRKAEKLLLRTAWPKDQITQVASKLGILKNNIDYMRLNEGLAIFISPDISKIFQLPFTVSEKIILADSFEIRDIVYFYQFLQPYYLIALSKKRIRLFKGRGRDLQEVVNTDFPKRYTEEYEYARPGIGSSSSAGLKSFEPDKSVMEELRMKQFFRTADDTLNKYLKSGMRLFVAGVAEEIVVFEHESTHAEIIAGEIRGNFDVDAVYPLAETAWKLINENVKSSQTKLLSKLQEDIGKKLVAEGIVAVWKAAVEGKGLILLLEKDYMVRGYLKDRSSGQLFIHPPLEDHEIIADAVDDVLEIVREKGGEIVIVENGDLSTFGRIALILRY